MEGVGGKYPIGVTMRMTENTDEIWKGLITYYKVKLFILSLRYSEYGHGQTRHKKEFVTSWRPQTTFGYKDDFDLERHKLETRKRISYLHAGYNSRQFYRYHSSPQILIRLVLTISNYCNSSSYLHFCPGKGIKRHLLV